MVMAGTPEHNDEPLDWGSDDEEKYAFLTSHTNNADNQTVLDLLLRSIKGSTCNSTKSEVNPLYCMNIGALDVLKCKHDIFFSQCAKCREKISSMWLLDSGASVHFTNKISNFINYEPASVHD